MGQSFEPATFQLPAQIFKAAPCNSWSKPIFRHFSVWGLNSSHKHVFHVDEPLVTSKLETLYLPNYSVIERFIFLQWGFHIVIESLFAEWHLYWPSLLCLKLYFMDMLEYNPVSLFAFHKSKRIFQTGNGAWSWAPCLYPYRDSSWS